MSEEQPTPEFVEKAVLDSSENQVNFQHVIITLADGRRGVFMGPELIKEIEMKLGTVPQLVDVVFDPPRAIVVPTREETPKTEETPSADQKIDDKPTAGLE